MKKAIVLLVFLYTFISCVFGQKPPQVKNFSTQVELCYCVGTPSNYHVKLRWDLISKCTRYNIYRVGQGVKLVGGRRKSKGDGQLSWVGFSQGRVPPDGITRIAP